MLLGKPTYPQVHPLFSFYYLFFIINNINVINNIIIIGVAVNTQTRELVISTTFFDGSSVTSRGFISLPLDTDGYVSMDQFHNKEIKTKREKREKERER